MRTCSTHTRHQREQRLYLVMPTKAICKPMPTMVPTLTAWGMRFMTTDATPVTDSTSRTKPATKHDVKACWRVKPSPPITRPYVRYADRPNPGPNPNGKLPNTPQMNEPTADATAVEMTMSVGGTDSLERSCGLTKRMYDMVKNVAVPARTSCSTVVFRSSSLKYRARAAMATVVDEGVDVTEE